MNKTDSNHIKEWIIFGAGLVTLIAGIVLTYISIYMPPVGEISGSVLTALGEFLTFAGSCLGIASYTTVKLKQIDLRANNEETK